MFDHDELSMILAALLARAETWRDLAQNCNNPSTNAEYRQYHRQYATLAGRVETMVKASAIKRSRNENKEAAR